MPTLRTVDPRALKLNADNPRRTPVPKEMDAQLVASIQAIGLLQPPVVRDIGGELTVRAGDRRTRAAIAAGLATIDVYVLDSEDTIDAMVSMSENLVRVGMNPVDTWRGIQRLEGQGWNEEAIAGALALPVRAVRKLKLLGSLHPPMLDVMAKGSMPGDEQLRTIANAPLEDQAQVWKAHKPKKGHEVSWWSIAHALSQQRIPLSAARFDARTAEEFGVVWHDDLFAPAGEDGRYTTNVDGFFAAQQAFMAASLPENGTILTLSEHGQPQLPKGAERIWGKPGKGDVLGHFVDPRSGDIETVAYRLPPPKKPAKADKNGQVAGSEAVSDAVPLKATRPEVTQRGLAIIGDYRTDALHQALDEGSIPNETLIGLLVLALAGKNVTIQGTESYGYGVRDKLLERVAPDGVLTADHSAIHAAARDMLKHVLSCRENMTNSGASSRIAGAAIGADDLLPTMATEKFLSCLSRQALEREAAEIGVPAGARVKDTRAAVVARFKDGGIWRFPGARFALTEAERKGYARTSSWVPGHSGENAERNGKKEESEGDDGYVYADAAD